MDYKDLRSIQEAYNAIHSEEVVEEGDVIDEMAPMKHVSTTPSGQKRYSTKDDGRHQRGVSPDGKPGGVNAPRTVGPTGAKIYSAVRGLKQRVGLGDDYQPEGEMTEGLAGMVDKASKAAQGGLERMGVKINRTPRPTARPSVRTQDTIRKNQSSMEEVDVFDIVKGHLIDEGATEEEALKAMLSMTEEQINAIVEGGPYIVTNADKKGNTPAYQNYLKGMKNKKTGEPLYKAAPHLRGV